MRAAASLISAEGAVNGEKGAYPVFILSEALLSAGCHPERSEGPMQINAPGSWFLRKDGEFAPQVATAIPAARPGPNFPFGPQIP